jgi:hypothetical protein
MLYEVLPDIADCARIQGATHIANSVHPMHCRMQRVLIIAMPAAAPASPKAAVRIHRGAARQVGTDFM